MAAEKQDRLALIPSDAVRVKVIDEKGQEKWRDVGSLLPSDEIVLDGGKPRVMKTEPGRKRKTPAPKPPPPTNDTVAALQAAKDYFLENDPLMQRVDIGIDDDAVLHLIMRGFAEEAASLAFERGEAERTGKETSQLSIRRISALRNLGDVFLKRKEQLSGKIIDMDSPAFANLFKFMTETFRESMINGGIGADQVEVIFQSLARRMSDDTWAHEARNRMKGA
jgi:hypothetical protein